MAERGGAGGCESWGGAVFCVEFFPIKFWIYKGTKFIIPTVLKDIIVYNFSLDFTVL